MSIDLRSDTVTRPSEAMRAAMATADVGDDVLDGDPTTGALEALVAKTLGKERALFFPSGSMANQAAIWVHTRPGTELLCDAEAHIYHWEIAGAAALCGVQCRPVKGQGLVYRADDLRAHIRTPSIHAPEPSLVCMENTHNGAGGVVTSVEEMQAIQVVAGEHGLPVHLDGARLWNAATALQRPLSDLASCADSVMVSFSKGLGAPLGACLAGSAEFITRAHRVRKRFGGGMRQSGVVAAAAMYALQHNYGRLAEDHASARHLELVLDGAGGAKVVSPDTNIVMIDLPKPVATDVVAKALELGVRISAWHPSRVRAVTHLDAPAGVVAEAAARIRQALEAVLA
ncbi:low specificity L-threonine aldolase [Gemmatimonas sp.]|uniref:threonine aldolase family protein n=1 Tax=Gemmatimonas sp. TaxID=1962908 RepID=UPI0027BABBC4|nr:GntG family PLP-dependent aldolase [Gemmatimonas sp.]